MLNLHFLFTLKLRLLVCQKEAETSWSGSENMMCEISESQLGHIRLQGCITPISEVNGLLRKEGMMSKMIKITEIDRRRRKGGAAKARICITRRRMCGAMVLWC